MYYCSGSGIIPGRNFKVRDAGVKADTCLADRMWRLGTVTRDNVPNDEAAALPHIDAARNLPGFGRSR